MALDKLEEVILNFFRTEVISPLPRPSYDSTDLISSNLLYKIVMKKSVRFGPLNGLIYIETVFLQIHRYEFACSVDSVLSKSLEDLRYKLLYNCLLTVSIYFVDGIAVPKLASWSKG